MPSRGLPAVLARMQGRDADGKSVDVLLDATGNLKVVTEAITIENVNVLAPLGVTVDDGADVALGAIGDAAWATGDGTVIAILKAIHAELVTANGHLATIAGA